MTTDRFSGFGAKGSRREVSVRAVTATFVPNEPLGRDIRNDA